MGVTKVVEADPGTPALAPTRSNAWERAWGWTGLPSKC